jgi:glucosamine-phosphate N-acetyltransferase
VRYKLKELEESDINESLFETLGNLRSCGELTVDKARLLLKGIKVNPLHKIYVALDGKDIVGIATIIIEQKFIRNGGKVGHIEDVATNKDYERKGIASAIIQKLISIAKEQGCYKVILDCSEENKPFYKKNGFKECEYEMRLDL